MTTNDYEFAICNKPSCNWNWTTAMSNTPSTFMLECAIQTTVSSFYTPVDRGESMSSEETGCIAQCS